MAQSYPNGRRVVAGLALASIAASVPVILFGPSALIVFPFALVTACIHAMFLAFPAYMILRRWFALGYLNAGVSGFLIGLLPVSLMIAPEYLGTAHQPWSWDLIWSEFGAPMMFGGLGAIGGLTFRHVVGNGSSDDDYSETFE